MEQPRLSITASFGSFMESDALTSLITSCRRIIAAFSGGADSAALLVLLRSFCEESRIPLTAVHVHHGIRGDEADRDAAFAAAFCKERAIDCRVVYVDAPKYSHANGIGMEEAARVLRYEVLDRIADEVENTLIATAHSADDNLETVLFRLVRGTALDGLSGIPPVRGRIIRPLLGASAAEIRSFCVERQIPYVTDSTNADTAYTRNYIRSEIVPVLRQIAPDPEASVSRMCESLRRDASYLKEAAITAMGEYKDKTEMPIAELCRLPDAILSRAITTLFENALGTKRDLTSTHIKDVTYLVRRGGYGRICLPAKITAVVSVGVLSMKPAAECVPPHETDERFPLRFGENLFPEYGFGIRMKRVEAGESAQPMEDCQNIYKLSIQKPIPFATIKGTVYMRFRKEGDVVRTSGMTKRVKKLLNEAKIDPDRRARLPILTDDEGILWIPGVAVRDSEKDAGESVFFTYFQW